ncbi:Alpha-(1,3)-fucosyltransferase 11, partial [Gamsiella multidivaricata]
MTRRAKKQIVLVGVAAAFMIGIVTLQPYSDVLDQNLGEQLTTTPDAHKQEPGTVKPSTVEHFSTHQDPFDYTDPYAVKDICNNLSKQHLHSRGMIITEKTQEDTLKVFVWRQQTFMDPAIDWKVESQTVCPFPPELQPFFVFNEEYHIQDKSIVWERGYAPCWFWTTNVWGNSRDVVETCGGARNQKYIRTQNYTEFRDADVVYMDYPFYNYIKEAPFWDHRRMPPRIAHQKWVLNYNGESITHHPHVALPSFLQQFDLTMGSPGPLFDIPYPLFAISEDQALKMANVQPQVPIDKKPVNYIAWVVSNCQPQNNRNELMQDMIAKIGAHSYGKCFHNKGFPTDLHDEIYNYDTKTKVLSAYPFTFVAENSNCLTYVTEKIYNGFQSGAIPIYLGAMDIADYVPKGSYINAQDFKNTDELVEFMKT